MVCFVPDVCRYWFAACCSLGGVLMVYLQCRVAASVRLHIESYFPEAVYGLLFALVDYMKIFLCHLDARMAQ